MNVKIVTGRNNFYTLGMVLLLGIILIPILTMFKIHDISLAVVVFIMWLYQEIGFLYFKTIGTAMLSDNSIQFYVANEPEQKIELSSDYRINIYDEESFKNIFKLYRVKRIHIYSKTKQFDEKLLYVRRSDFDTLETLINNWRKRITVNT